MEDSRNIEIDTYEQEFGRLIEKIIGIKLEGMSTSAATNLGGTILFQARLPERNSLFKNTDYLLTNTKKILHFTSLQALYSIINEGHLRLYNLYNSNDPKEYEYAALFLENIYNLYRIPNFKFADYLNYVKQNSYIFSCTDISEIKNVKFWEEYADNKRGIAIEFEIINEPSDWCFFYFAKVKYSELDIISKLSNEWKSIQRKYPQNTYKISLNQLLSFHKSSSWENEKEIRILTQPPSFFYFPFPFRNHVFRDFKINKPNVIVNYFRLSLCDKTGYYIDKNLNESKSDFHKNMPKLRISNIYFGPDFPIEGRCFLDFQQEIRDYISCKMNCWLTNIPKNKITFVKN